MKADFRSIRVRQLEKALQPFFGAKSVVRQQRGWIQALRQAAGLSVRELARRLDIAPSAAAHLEKSEAEYRITLGRLRDAADAIGCQLVYALVPKTGSVESLVEQRARAQAEETVRAVEHSMSLEDQAVGNVEEKIEEHTRRILKNQ